MVIVMEHNTHREYYANYIEKKLYTVCYIDFCYFHLFFIYFYLLL